jgi:hypothetical protein
MKRHGPDTDQLLDNASRGDGAARAQLLDRHRQRLRQMIALRIDRRLAARVDPSDVVQEALITPLIPKPERLEQYSPWHRPGTQKVQRRQALKGRHKGRLHDQPQSL